MLDPPHLYSHSATGLSASPSLSFYGHSPRRDISHRWPLAATRPHRSRTSNVRGCWRRSDNGTHNCLPRPQGKPRPRPSRTAPTRQLSPVSERFNIRIYGGSLGLDATVRVYTEAVRLVGSILVRWRVYDCR